MVDHASERTRRKRSGCPDLFFAALHNGPTKGTRLDQVAGDHATTDGGIGGAYRALVLREVERFGANPGNLRMLIAAPEGGSHRRRPLVVVLHGCGQTAAGYDAASGWSRLAARHGFAVLYAEQRRANNDQTCFSWFRPQDIARTGGEAESIREMVAKAITEFGIDVRRVFVCGLSAGGAMAAAMLATYPEVFAGGAVIAGLPYGAAASAGEAFEAMYGGKVKEPRVWGGLVRAAAAGYAGSWPSIAVWQGTADRVVKPINTGELVKQWTDVHGVAAATPVEDKVGPAKRRVWSNASGRACVTEYTLAGMAHGAPVDDVDPPAPFFLPVGLSSTQQIASDFGLTAPPAMAPVKRLLSMIGLAGS